VTRQRKRHHLAARTAVALVGAIIDVATVKEAAREADQTVGKEIKEESCIAHLLSVVFFSLGILTAAAP